MYRLTYLIFCLICFAGCQKFERIQYIQINQPAITSATDTTISTITVCYTLTDLGKTPIKAFGVCYDTLETFAHPHYIPYDTIPTTETFSQKVNGLAYNTKYYLKTYIFNTNGTYFYSSVVQKKTANIETPSFSFNTSFVSYIFDTTWIHFAIDKTSFINGNDPNTVFGVCYSSQTNVPTIGNDTIVIKNGIDSIKITNLIPDSKYTFRAFAKNKFTTNYSSTVTVRTSVCFNGIEMVQLYGADSTGGAFYMGRYEISNEVWNAVVAGNKPNGKGTLPKTNITKATILSTFIAKLDSMTSGITGFSIPTPAQWMYAARGKNGNDVFTYSGSNDIKSVGYFFKNTNNSLQQIGSLKQNSAGIFDMTGNASEICTDDEARGGNANQDSTLCYLNAPPILLQNGTSQYAGFRIIRTK